VDSFAFTAQLDVIIVMPIDDNIHDSRGGFCRTSMPKLTKGLRKLRSMTLQRALEARSSMKQSREKDNDQRKRIWCRFRSLAATYSSSETSNLKIETHVMMPKFIGT